MEPSSAFRRINGQGIWVIDAKWVAEDGSLSDVNLGVLNRDLEQYAKHFQVSMLAQFGELVVPGTILAEHIFKGLNRPLFCDGSREGDQDKLVYSRKPQFDYQWIGGKHGGPVEVRAAWNTVFVVIVSPNKRHRDEFPTIAGWIDRWSWMEEDRVLRGAPTGWVDRFVKKLYSKER